MTCMRTKKDRNFTFVKCLVKRDNAVQASFVKRCISEKKAPACEDPPHCYRMTVFNIWECNHGCSPWRSIIHLQHEHVGKSPLTTETFGRGIGDECPHVSCTRMRQLFIHNKPVSTWLYGTNGRRKCGDKKWNCWRKCEVLNPLETELSAIYLTISITNHPKGGSTEWTGKHGTPNYRSRKNWLAAKVASVRQLHGMSGKLSSYDFGISTHVGLA